MSRPTGSHRTPRLEQPRHPDARNHDVAPGQRPDQRIAGNFVQRSLCPAHVLAVGIQLADALVALHGLGVVHRDIHGSNVLIDFAAGPVTRPIVRLFDLGMCELLPAWFARVHRCGTPPEHRVALGTGGLEQFAWTAPEARRERVWTEKCDVWSAGLLLFQLLTGHRPAWPRQPSCRPPRTAPRNSPRPGNGKGSTQPRGPRRRVPTARRVVPGVLTRHHEDMRGCAHSVICALL